MKKYLLLLFISTLLWQPASHAAFFHDPDLIWSTLKTEHFEIHYHNGEESLVPRVADIAEKAHVRITDFFSWEPNGRTHLILTDRMDFSNAFAMPIPRNTMFIILTPPGDNETISDYHDWLELVITHEYVHIVHVDKVKRIPRGARNIFGRIALFFPNALQPLWVLEGIASYLETQLEPGIGRGTNTAFRNLMRIEVAAGIKPISQVNLPIVSWPAGTARYLYGVYFFNFLRDNYGEDEIKQWVENYSGNLVPFMMNSTARSVFQKDMTLLWEEFTDYLLKEFNPEIEKLRQSGLIEGKQITTDGYLTGYPRSNTNGDIVYFKNNWQEHPRLMLLPAGKTEPVEISEVYSGNFDVHDKAGVLIAQIDNFRNVNYFSDLYKIEIPSGKKTQLTDGGRYKTATWNPDGNRIAAVHIKNGNAALHLLQADGTFLKTLWQGQNHEMVSALDWHPTQNHLVASVWRPGTHWNLEAFDIDSLQWRKLTNTLNLESQPQYTVDGTGVLFSADYDIASNIYRMDATSGEITQVTNVLGGATSATALPDNSGYFYTGQHANGTDVYFLASAEAANKTITPDSPPLESTAEKTVEPGGSSGNVSSYNAFENIYPTAWFPYIEITEDTSEIGISTYGADPLNWHQYSAILAVDTDNQWPLGAVSYTYDRWRTALKLYLQRDVVVLRDNADNVNSYRNEDLATFEAVYPFFKRDYQWSLHAGIGLDRESDRQVEPGGIAIDDSSDDLLGLAVTFNSARFYPLGVSPADGFKWRLVAEDSDSLDSDFTGQVYTLDWRGYFSLPASNVLAARLVSGTSTDFPRPFRLGGLKEGFQFANPGATLIEPTPLVFNKRKYALRGYKKGLAQLTGDHMNLVELEWRFPVSLIERTLMIPPLGVNKIYGKLFYSAGDAWYDDTQSADYLESAGIEFNANMFFGYFIPLNVKVGYAKGLDKDLGEEEVYLQLGLSF